MNQTSENPAYVLIVNDDRVQLDLLRDLLTSEGYKVLVADSARRALELTAVTRTDLIVCDVVMPEMNGIELCGRLKRNSYTAAIPVLLVSAIRKEDADIREGFAAGADDYMEIPFRHEQLLVKVARLIERHRIERRYREIVEHAAEIIYTRDMEGRITSINKAGACFFGKAAFQLIGQPLADLIGVDAAARNISALKNAQSFEPVRFTENVKNALGEERHLEGIATIERGSDGEGIAVRAVVRDVTERWRAEVALQKQNDEYRLLFESNPCPMYVCDEKTLQFLAVNEAAIEHYGYTRDEFLEMTALDIRPTEDVPALLSYVSNHLQPRAAAGVWKHKKKDGSLIDVDVNWHRLDFAGRPSYLVMANDITEKKRAQVAVAESEERYRELFENANDIIYTIDLAGNFTSLNQTGERLTGYTRDEALTMNITQVVAPDYLEIVRQNLARKIQNNDASSVYETEIITKSGKRLRLELSSRLIHRDGKPIGVQGVARDISERKLAEVALRDSEEKFRSIVETTNEWIWAIDLEGSHTYTNPAIEQILGYTPDEILSANALSFLHPEDRRQVEELLPKWIAEKQGWTGLVRRWKHKRGGYRYLESNGEPILDSSGNVISFRGADRDITERRLAEEQVLRRNQELAALNEIGHELSRLVEPAEIAKLIHKMIGKVIDNRSVYVALYDEREREVSFPVYTIDGEPYHSPPRKFGRGLTEHIIASKKALLINGDLEAKLNQLGVVSSGRHAQCWLAVPMLVGEKVVGVITIQDYENPAAYDKSHQDLLSTIASHAGIAVENARLYAAMKQQAERAALTNRISQAVRRTLDVSEVFHTAVRELGEHLGVDRCSLFMKDEKAGRVTNAAEYHVADVEPAGANFDLPKVQSLNAAMEKHGVMAFDDVADNEKSRALYEGVVKRDVKSIMYVGVRVGDELLGAFALSTTKEIRHWSEADIEVAKAAADQTGIAIRQARLYQTVARAKKEWESTFDAMSDGIFIFDKDGRLVRVNRAGAAMDDAPPESLLGRLCCDILRTTSDGAACIVEQALRKAGSINVEVVPQKLNRPVLVTVEPVVDELSQTIGAVCTARDLSELRSVEAVARERQSLLKNIMESAREAIYALDVEGHYKWCNQAMLDMTGYASAEIIGHSFLERVHEDDREMRRQRFASVLAGKPQSFETRYIASDGNVRFATVNSAPIIVDGEITGVLGIAHDITEHKQERERAARADKLRALGQLASGVAHDFNNSLAAILGRAQLILRRVKDEELIRSLGIIVTAAEDAAATVRRIQTFARKPLAAELELVDVSNLLRDAIEITRTRWENEARAAGLNVEVKFKGDAELFAKGNPSELREVFVNLIVNAVDAMPHGGSLTICAQRKGERVHLRFADTGIGMKEEVRERVFEPFYTTKGVHGTGLGLAVSYGIIERHDGIISVASKVGKGTTFHIELPLAAHEDQSRDEAPILIGAQSLSILVIDDEEFVRETLAEMLADLNHRIVSVASGRAALERISKGSFDVVFTDLAMPEMDGWEIARAIRDQRSDLPVVLVTGYGATVQPPSGASDLVDGIIGKPFDFDQVSATLARVCSKERESSSMKPAPQRELVHH